MEMGPLLRSATQSGDNRKENIVLSEIKLGIIAKHWIALELCCHDECYLTMVYFPIAQQSKCSRQIYHDHVALFLEVKFQRNSATIPSLIYIGQ